MIFPLFKRFPIILVLMWVIVVLPALALDGTDISSECFELKKIRLVGKEADHFQWVVSEPAVKSVLGHCLDSQGINLLKNQIQNIIIRRGLMTSRVLSGPQANLKEGVLELTIFPGRIRQIHFSPSLSFRQAFWSPLPVKEGEVLNLRDLEQAIENCKRLPTVSADIKIVPAEGPGIEPGQSDLLIQWKKQFPFRLSLSVDDSGSKATDKYQGSATFFYDGWKMSNHLFYISFNRHLSPGNTRARGAQGLSLHYSFPVGYWLFSVTNSNNEYRQSVPGVRQIYIYSGDSHNLDLKVSRVIYRNLVRKTTLSLSAWTRESKSFIDDTEVAVQRRRMGGWDFGASHREFIHTATLDMNLHYRLGTGTFGALRVPEEASGEGTSRPQIIMADLQFNLPFQLAKQRLRYNNTWRARWNQTPLVPLDRFAIGGRYTVRGFDGENQLLAEHGWLVRHDLGLAVRKTSQEVYIGLDYGTVGGNSSQNLIGHSLSGAVLGLRCDVKNFSYDLFAGKPLSKPNGFKTSPVVLGFNLNLSF